MGIEGPWFSQHQPGSKFEILPVAEGILTGLYEPAAGSGSCARGQFPLQGRTDIGRGGSTFGFAVNWHNAESSCNSTTVWAGQYVDTPGAESLTTFWVLVTNTTHQSGEDHYTRVASSAAGAPGGGPSSHP